MGAVSGLGGLSFQYTYFKPCNILAFEALKLEKDILITNSQVWERFKHSNVVGKWQSTLDSIELQIIIGDWQIFLEQNCFSRKRKREREKVGKIINIQLENLEKRIGSFVPEKYDKSLITKKWEARTEKRGSCVPWGIYYCNNEFEF